MKFRRTFVLCCWVLVVCACRGAAPRPDVVMPSAAEARQRLERDGLRRLRLDALLNARAGGLASALGAARVDVALESPARMVFAVRSFFDQPLYTLATDGVVMTSIDSRSAGGARFHTGPVTGRETVEWLGIELWPRDVVQMFLGIMPVAGSDIVDYRSDDAAGTYRLRVREPGGRLSEIEARARDDAPITWSAYQPDGLVRFRVSYGEHVTREGVSFASTWRVEVFDDRRPGRSLGEATFEAEWWELNGAPHPDEAFRLSPLAAQGGSAPGGVPGPGGALFFE